MINIKTGGNMKTIMLDMDNVITDGSFKELIEEFLNIEINLEQTTEYGYVQKYTEPFKDEFWEWIKDKNFYENAPFNCKEVLERIKDKYNIFIVTSYLWKETIDLSSNNLKNKYEYLRKELPFISPEKYIFTTNKNLLNFDIKIDDRIDNLKGGKIKLLFTAWHNKNISDEELKKDNIIRVNNWQEIENILTKELNI